MTHITGEFAAVALSSREIRTRTDTAQSQRREQRHLLTDELKALPFELSFSNGERITLDLVGIGMEPSALWRVFGSFQQMSALPPGWDSYGAQPLTKTAVLRSVNLIDILLSETALEPTVVPTRDGGVQFEWHRRGIDLEVKVPPTGPMSFLFVDANTGEEYDGEGDVDRRVVQDALARMAQAA